MYLIPDTRDPTATLQTTIVIQIFKLQTIVIELNEGVAADHFERNSVGCYNRSVGSLVSAYIGLFILPKNIWSLRIYDTSLETWKVILRLATQHKFSQVKNLAFRELNTPGKLKFSLVEMVVLYPQFKAEKKYLDPLYKDLLWRIEHLT